MGAVVSDVFLDAKGYPLEGSVVFTPDSTLFVEAGIVPPSPVVAVLDESGAFTVELEATDTGNPVGWTYEVSERVKGGRSYHAAIVTGTHKLSELAPVPESAGNPIVRGPRGYNNVLTVGTVETKAASTPAEVSITGESPAQVVNFKIPQGVKGDPNSLAVGTVTTGAPGTAAGAAITGQAPSQTLSLTIPRGDKGEPNSLSVGTVDTLPPESQATATITGAAPSQTLHLGIPYGPLGVVRVDHGSDANVARPDRPLVYWVGSARPVNALASDFWLNG